MPWPRAAPTPGRKPQTQTTRGVQARGLPSEVTGQTWWQRRPRRRTWRQGLDGSLPTPRAIRDGKVKTPSPFPWIFCLWLFLVPSHGLMPGTVTGFGFANLFLSISLLKFLLLLSTARAFILSSLFDTVIFSLNHSSIPSPILSFQ